MKKIIALTFFFLVSFQFLPIVTNPVFAFTSDPIPGAYGLGTDGSTSYFYNSSIVPNTSGDASFDFWFYWKNAGNYEDRQAFFTTGSPNADSPSYLFWVYPDGHLGMYDNAGHSCAENLSHNWTQNTWYHIYWGRNATTGVCYFGVNGIVTTSFSSSGNYGGQSTGLWWGVGIYGKVNGTFDEIRVSDTVRWTNNFSIPTSEYIADAHTIALWHMNEGSGEISIDDSGNGYTLTLSGAAWEQGYFNGSPISSPTPLPTSIPGTYGLGTDGSPLSYLYNTSIIPNRFGDASFDFWFYWKNPGNYADRQAFFTTGSPNDNVPSYLFYVQPDGQLGMYNNAGHHCVENGTHTWTQNTWYHIYWGRNASTGTCYFGVNGTVTTASSSIGNYTGSGTGLWWGTGIYGRVNGTFDEIRVSDIVRWTSDFNLSTSEYTTDANTIALWHMNEGSGPTSVDDSGNGYTLALSNATWDPGYFDPLPTPTSTATNVATHTPTETPTITPSITPSFIPTATPVIFNFNGFFSPVGNPPKLNTLKAGKEVIIKFSLGGYQGLDIFAPGYPTSGVVVCGSTAEDAVEQTFSSNGLTYDSAADRYIYKWKTDDLWAGTCRTFVLKLSDGTYHRANFKFN